MALALAKKIVQSSIIKKAIMSVTGLCLFGFLIGHLLGNSTALIDADLFNTYAHKLTTNPLIMLPEMGIAVLFLIHITFATILIFENWQARPQSYYLKRTSGQGSNLASSTMLYTGPFILIFTVIHLFNFKYGPITFTSYPENTMRDLYKTLVDYFAIPWHLGFYLLIMGVLSVHLTHGLWSAMQTLGFNHAKYDILLRRLSLLTAIIIGGAFAAISVILHFKGVHS